MSFKLFYKMGNTTMWGIMCKYLGQLPMGQQKKKINNELKR